jgi:uridine kinase
MGLVARRVPRAGSALAARSEPYTLFGARADMIHDLLFTTMQATLAAIVLNMHLFGVRSNAVYRTRTRPTLVGLSGDSGAGKDTFTRLLTDVFGRGRTTVVCGDDYHRWTRGHAMWQVHTHLDVRANNLHQQHDHAIALARGEGVLKGQYDHKTGEFTQPEAVDPGDVVIFQGLHALAIHGVRDLYDLRVFLDPEEDLRRLWKVRRDSRERGYSPARVIEALSDRQKDRVRYILPQREHAELIVRWCPVSAVDLSLQADPELVLEVTALNSFNFGRIAARLREEGSLVVDHEPFIDARWQRLRVSGHVAIDTVHRVAHEEIPSLHEITEAPRFASDLHGVVQLFFLCALSEKFRWGRDERIA